MIRPAFPQLRFKKILQEVTKMTEDNADKNQETTEQGDQSKTDLPQAATTSDVLSGADKLVDG
jgi:hypothetical protein